MDFMFDASGAGEPQPITSENLRKMIDVVANNMFNNKSAMYTLPIFPATHEFEVVKIGKHGAKIRYQDTYGYVSYSLIFPSSTVKFIGDTDDNRDNAEDD